MREEGVETLRAGTRSVGKYFFLIPYSVLYAADLSGNPTGNLDALSFLRKDLSKPLLIFKVSGGFLFSFSEEFFALLLIALS